MCKLTLDRFVFLCTDVCLYCYFLISIMLITWRTHLPTNFTASLTYFNILNHLLLIYTTNTHTLHKIIEASFAGLSQITHNYPFKFLIKVNEKRSNILNVNCYKYYLYIQSQNFYIRNLLRQNLATILVLTFTLLLYG